MAESEGGLGRCKKFGGAGPQPLFAWTPAAGVQAKRGSANVDVEVEVIFWFHCAIVSSPLKEEGKVSRSRPSPGESSVLATACRALARCESLL